MRHLFVICVACAVAGCGGVVSENPASDDATTRIDERLIGFWRIDSEASGGKAKKDAEPPPGEFLFVVGKRPGPDGGLEYMLVALDKDGKLDTGRAALRATTIAGKTYVSARSFEEEGVAKTEKPKAGWFILRYDVPEAGVLHVLAMDEATVTKDVNEKKIAGKVPPPPSPALTPADGVMIELSATTEALRAWLESRGEALFAADKPLVLRRLELR